MEFIYVLKDVSYQYSHEPVLEHVDMKVGYGDYIGIIGENGGGKTTLLRLLIGEISPQSGDLFFMGEKGVTSKNKTKIAYVPQIDPASKHNFPIHCEEFIALGLVKKTSLRPYLKKSEKAEIYTVMDQLGIRDLTERNFHELSGGQKQRVLIAKALVKKPQVLVLDEPTVGIDEGSKDLFFEILDHLNKKHQITIIMVTHETKLGVSHWDRTFVLDKHSLEESCLNTPL